MTSNHVKLQKNQSASWYPRTPLYGEKYPLGTSRYWLLRNKNTHIRETYRALIDSLWLLSNVDKLQYPYSRSTNITVKCRIYRFRNVRRFKHQDCLYDVQLALVITY